MSRNSAHLTRIAELVADGDVHLEIADRRPIRDLHCLSARGAPLDTIRRRGTVMATAIAAICCMIAVAAARRSNATASELVAVLCSGSD